VIVGVNEDQADWAAAAPTLLTSKVQPRATDIPKLEAGISLMSEDRDLTPKTGLFQNVDAS